MPKVKILSKAEKDDLAIVWAKSLVDDARKQHFYGKLILHIENGVPKRVENNRSLFPPP